MRVIRNTGSSKDPVCGMTVDPQTASSQTSYKGQQHYFCSQQCLQKFQSAPHKYGLTKKKGIWARYIERLNKAMAENPPSCHG